MTTTGLNLSREWARLIARPLHALGVLIVPWALLACTEFEDGDDTLASTAGLPNSPTGGESPAGGPWSCLEGERMAAPPPALGATSVTFTIFIADTVTRRPPEGLNVAACSPLDIECARPMTEGARPDADGSVRIRVPLNFAGFFRVLSDQTLPSVLFIDGALGADTVAPPMLLIGQLAFQALTQSQNLAVDPMMGALLLRAYDCDRAPAPGIRFTNDRGGQPFTFIDGLPVVGQTVTDAEGTGGFLNVLPGLAVVQSLLAGSSVLTRTASGRVRAGWFTYVDLDAAP